MVPLPTAQWRRILELKKSILNQSATKEKKHGRSQPSALQATASANNKFSLSLYKLLNANSTEGSLVMSPVSLQLALAMTYVGARGRTAEQMETVLHLPTDEDAVKTGFRQLLSSLKSSGSVSLEVANRMYIQATFKVLKDFRRTVRKTFRSDTKEVNFVENHEKARRIINNWVEKRTRHKIKQMIGPGTLNAMTRLILVNAVHFKARWLQPFNSEDTEMGKFHISRNEEVDVPMMHMKTFFSFKHSDSLGAKILELQYEGDTVSMFILLPDDLEGIYNLERGLPAVDLSSTFKDMQPEELNITLPKFKIETSLDLKSNLMELGMKDMFLMESADFSGITGSPDLYVSDVLQKAFLEVTELGTEAGASSAVVAEARSWRPPPLEFVADHPFLFIIWEKRLNTTLFMGRFLGPE
ncbi:Leukocyte elastase inhibitor C [Cryptotermes secundus]|uniref:Leukocyte elastase inhibitor C n=1 Tax=Cryptotermes secundus TaxID=105785 RepID=A0A2J7QZM9_9NEOP|nr:leukocyte elastase inhibitor isoform X2 [Cryptotermes secundus]PNF34040.1 Leukocyte elastase inhibitor C [Cryptotermes secundus]